MRVFFCVRKAALGTDNTADSHLIPRGSTGVGHLLVATRPTPILVAWAGFIDPGPMLRVYVATRGKWRRAFDRQDGNIIVSARQGAKGPHGQRAVMIEWSSGGSDGVGGFWNARSLRRDFGSQIRLKASIRSLVRITPNNLLEIPTKWRAWGHNFLTSGNAIKSFR